MIPDFLLVSFVSITRVSFEGFFHNFIHSKYATKKLSILSNLVPRSLVDEAEGEIWPNPICST